MNARSRISPSAASICTIRRRFVRPISSTVVASRARMRTRLEGPDDRVMNGPKMLRGVLVLRGVTAADVAARETQAEMNPLVSSLETVFAAPSARRDLADLLQVGASGHGVAPWGRSVHP